MDFGAVLEKQWKLVLGVLVAALVVTGVVVVANAQSAQKEKKAQESYFAVEKQYLDLKTKQSNPDPKAKDQAPVDFTAVKAAFEKVITDHPQSIAAQMAALHIASLLVEEKNFDAALATLQKVESKDKGLVNTLVQQQIGQLLADKEKCTEAITVWQKIIDRKEAAFLHNETKIQQALCYTKINDLKKAEEILTNLANQNANQDMGNSSASKEAEKYLRLIQFKKASGT
jgi:predicted negative regulator of RcsB-dependent stress response